MKKLGYYYILLFMGLCVQTIYAQSPYFYAINDETGLPSNEVYQLKQDSFGFMWIASDGGLFKYNGFSYEPYTHPKQNSISLSNITIDAKQNVWCQNFTGQIFNTNAQEKQLQLIFDGSANSRVMPVYTVDQASNAWIAIDSSIQLIDKSGALIKSYSYEKFGLEAQQLCFDIEYHLSGKLYLLNYKGQLIIFNTKTEEVDIFQIETEKQNRLSLFHLNDRIILFEEALPIRHYSIFDVTNGSTKLLNSFPPIDRSGLCYTITAFQDKYMLCTSSGAMILDQKFKAVDAYSVLFEKHKISFSYTDKEGNSWFSSLQDGLFVVPAIDLQFFNADNSILKDDNISALTQIDEHNLFIGSYLGDLYQLNVDSFQLQKIEEKQEGKYRAVRKIHQYKNKIYVARGLFSIIDADAKTEIIPELNNCRDFQLVGSDSIYYVRPDVSGFLSKENGKWKQHILKNVGGKKVLYDKKQEAVYYACNDGLFIYQDGTLKELQYEDEAIYGSSFYLDENQLWIGTNNKGVLLYSEATFSKHYHEQNLLTDNNIRVLTKAGDTLWVACKKGLNFIDLKKDESAYYNEFDGLAYKEISGILVHKGYVYLSSIKAFLRMPVDLVWQNKVAPAISLISIQEEGKDLGKTASIELAYHNHNLRIDFIATAFRSRQSFHYEYRLKGFEDRWTKVHASTPYVNFPSLPSGDYIFELVAVNEDGFRSVHPIEIAIEVKAALWQRWWFYLIASLVIITILFFIFRARLLYVKKNAAIQYKLALSQLTALKSQMNPHFLYNALNSIQALNAKKETAKANYYLSKFSQLMRKILEASGEKFILLEDEITWLKIYLELEKLRFGDDFSFEFITEERIDSYDVWIPSMILQPFIENAIKHGLLHEKSDRKLSIEFQLEGEKLISKIKDNGVGRKKVAEIQKRLIANHKSFATTATEKRIELLNQMTKDTYSFQIIDLYENEEAVGTLVEIHIPLLPFGKPN